MAEPVSTTLVAIKFALKALLKKLSTDAIKKSLKKAVKKGIKKRVKEGIKKRAKKFLKRKTDKRQIAKNILQQQGEYEGGGALAVSSPTAIATTPLLDKKESALAIRDKGGELVKSDKIDFQALGQKIDNIAGMVEAVERLTGVQKKQKEDAKKARQVALDKSKKAQREQTLEKKKGLGAKVGGAIKKKAEGPLAFLMRFIGNVIVGGFVMFLLQNIKRMIKLWEGIKKGFLDFFWIIRAFLWKGFIPKTLFQSVMKVGKVITGAFKLIGQGISNAGKLILNAFGKAGNAVGGWIGNIATKAKDLVVNAAKGVGTWIKNAFPALTNMVGRGLNAVGGALRGARDVVGGALRGAKDVVGGALQGVKGAIGGALSGARDAVGGVVRGIGGKIGGAFKGIQGALGMGAKGGAKVAGGVAGRVGGVIAKAGKLGGKLLAGAGGILSKAKGLFGRIPIIGPLMVALASILSGDPPQQTLFKAVGSALGGLAGSFIPIPILGTIMGEMLGEFVGDLFYTLISGGGMQGVIDKVKAKFTQLLTMGKNVGEWLGGGFKRYTENFLKETAIDIPEGGGRWTALTKVAEVLGLKDWLKGLGYVNGDGYVTKFPNLLQLLNPFKTIPLLIKSFFPPGESTPAETPSPEAQVSGEGESEESSTDTSISGAPSENDIPREDWVTTLTKEDIILINNEREKYISDVSVSASYEQPANTEVLVQASSPSVSSGGGGGGGGTQVLPLGSREALNNYYKSINVTAPLYKG